MFLRSLLLGATAALRVNALLVVPEGEPVTSSEVMAGLAPVEAQLAQQQLIDLPCTECPFREVGEDGDVSWTDGSKTSLVRCLLSLFPVGKLWLMKYLVSQLYC